MVGTSLSVNEDHVYVFAFVFLCFTFMDERIIVPPLLPPLLDLFITENVLPLTRIAASKTEKNRS